MDFSFRFWQNLLIKLDNSHYHSASFCLKWNCLAEGMKLHDYYPNIELLIKIWVWNSEGLSKHCHHIILRSRRSHLSLADIWRCSLIGWALWARSWDIRGWHSLVILTQSLTPAGHTWSVSVTMSDITPASLISRPVNNIYSIDQILGNNKVKQPHSPPPSIKGMLKSIFIKLGDLLLLQSFDNLLYQFSIDSKCIVEQLIL